LRDGEGSRRGQVEVHETHSRAVTIIGRWRTVTEEKSLIKGSTSINPVQDRLLHIRNGHQDAGDEDIVNRWQETLSGWSS